MDSKAVITQRLMETTRQLARAENEREALRAENARLEARVTVLEGGLASIYAYLYGTDHVWEAGVDWIGAKIRVLLDKEPAPAAKPRASACQVFAVSAGATAYIPIEHYPPAEPEQKEENHGH